MGDRRMGKRRMGERFAILDSLVPGMNRAGRESSSGETGGSGSIFFVLYLML